MQRETKHVHIWGVGSTAGTAFLPRCMQRKYVVVAVGKDECNGAKYTARDSSAESHYRYFSGSSSVGFWSYHADAFSQSLSGTVHIGRKFRCKLRCSVFDNVFSDLGTNVTNRRMYRSDAGVDAGAGGEQKGAE